ncbi:MAG: cytochrome-c peroxidase [candidate division NC10 bacterium]|nr:cytochrome-c peroxidase [candidate division NC10 bacterium]
MRTVRLFSAALGSLLLGALLWTGGALGQAQRFAPLGPLPPVPVPPDNPMSAAKIELGQLLFWDTRLSGDASTSCASCHDPKQGWGDGGKLSRGYPGTEHWRNSQTVLNAAYYSKLFWAGEVTSLESQADAAAAGNVAGNGDPIMMEERLRQIPEYVRRFKEVFGVDRPTISMAWMAIATFERTLVSKAEDVPFDRYAKRDQSALSPEAKRGIALFQGKAGCVQCHNGPLLSDESYHNLGVPRNPEFESNPLRQITLRYQHVTRGVPEKIYRSADRDLGLYYITKQEIDKGKFRTPSLRELKYTAPYMHNGTFETLEEVIDFYNRGAGDDPNKSSLVKPLGLSDRERKELLAFLLSLSSDHPLIVEPPDLPGYVALK